MGIGYNPRIVTDGLVLCLDAANSRSYPRTGTTWTDLKGGNDGTLTNSPTFDSANGGSIVFDATNEHVQTNTFSLGDTFSVSFWMYVRQLYNYGDPLGATTDSNTDYGMSFVTYLDGHMVFNVGGGSSWPTACSTSTGAISAGDWYFVSGIKSSSNTFFILIGSLLIRLQILDH